MFPVVRKSATWTPVDELQVVPLLTYSVYRVPDPDVQYVRSPPQAAGILTMTVTVGYVAGSTLVAQWRLRRILSSARRAFCCAWKRVFMSTSAFEPDTKMVTRPPRMIPRIIITIRSSIIE